MPLVASGALVDASWWFAFLPSGPVGCHGGESKFGGDLVPERNLSAPLRHGYPASLVQLDVHLPGGYDTNRVDHEMYCSISADSAFARSMIQSSIFCHLRNRRAA